MPELPEVETTRRDLCKLLTSQSIDSLEISGQRTVRRGVTTDALIPMVKGARVCRVRRWGKFLTLELTEAVSARSPQCGIDSRSDLLSLNFHLGMSGRFILDSNQISRPHHVKAVVNFSGQSLRFYDPRTFGEVFVSTEVDSRGRPVPLVRLGFDPLEEREMYLQRASEVLSSSRSAIKARLLDQRVVCGVGNIYSDEILFRCGISPTRPCSSLSDSELESLVTKIPEVLTEAVEARGSSLSDMSYLDFSGQPGSYQNNHLVYGRGGKRCGTCETVITKSAVGGRSAHYCDTCQR